MSYRDPQRRKDYQREFHRARRAAWRAAGLCYGCGGPRDCGLLRCRRCLDAQKDYRLRFRERGLPPCPGCGLPFARPGRGLCGFCERGLCDA
jgi:hypothetical protein